MKSALVHYWLVHRRGGEKVLDAIASMLPSADLLTHVLDPALLTGALEGRKVRTTFIDRLPLARRRYAMYLPLMPLALEMLNMSQYDLVVSSEAGPSKWIIPDPDAHHVCYCHSPLRYIWDQKDIYLSRFPGFLRIAAEMYASKLRDSDFHSSVRVDTFVANSHFVARRIWKYYRRDAEVVHPPVDVHTFVTGAVPDDYYLLAGELRAYKGVAAAVRACAQLGRRLVIVGGGDHRELRKIAGPLTEFRGRVSDTEFKAILSRCRALLFPGVEDFGIVPVEAMASGRPVIALSKGGALDTVLHGETGLLYTDNSVEGLKRAIIEFEAEEYGFKTSRCIEQAWRFRPEVFRRKFAACLPSGAMEGAESPTLPSAQGAYAAAGARRQGAPI
jgi:glycosyltransferase involved in cell wall biosynthesis